MPGTQSHPGVYVAELAGAPPAIVAAPTSTAAFVGRAARGPVDAPVAVASPGDLARAFGGPSTVGTLGHAVRDYLANGGTEAVVVRAYRPPAGRSGVAVLDGGPLRLCAASPGAWGRLLRWRLQRSERAAARPVARALGVAPADLFDLAVRDGETEERFTHLTLRDTPRRVDRVLAADSRLVRWRAARVSTWRRLPLVAVDPVTAAQGAPGATPASVAAAVDALGADDGLPPDLDATARALDALERGADFALLCLPPDAGDGDVDAAARDAAARCCDRRRAFLLVDAPAAWATPADAAAGVAALVPLGASAAVYFPRLRQPDPARGGAVGTFAPCGAVAGVLARTDATRGVWKAPAGVEAALLGVPALALALGDAEQGALNPLGVNVLRSFPGRGPVVWGARTLLGDDRLASEWKYVPVRRLALFLERSIDRGLQWAAFERDAERLWQRVRVTVEDFLHALFRQGAFQGRTPGEAYFVRCDATTMTPLDVAEGRLNVVVGLAPLKPAAFVLLSFGLHARRPDDP